ncbi:MAG: hypothetical protein QM756_44245 [Polyangiaceae bacterium]
MAFSAGLAGRSAGAVPPDVVEASLQVESEPSCVALAPLSARVQQRSRRLRFVPASAAVPNLRVRVAPAGQSISVELQVMRPGGRRSVRWLRARSCDDALEATALVIAITLDASASTEDMSGDASSTSSGGSSGGAQSNPTGDAQGGAGASRNVDAAARAGAANTTPGVESKPKVDRGSSPAEELEPTEEPEPTDAAVNGASADRVLRLQVGASGRMRWGAAPVALPGAAATLIVGWERTGFSPALLATFAHSFERTVDEANGSATFSAETLVVDLCPLGLRAAPLTLRLCAEAVVAALAAQGGNTFSPRARTRPYFVLGGALEGGLDLGARLVLISSFGLGKTLIQDDFAFSPTVFYSVPNLGFEAAAGLAMRFP